MRMTTTQLTMLALGAVFVIIMIWAITSWMTPNEGYLDDLECAQSIEQHLRIRKASGGLTAPPIECKTNIVEVKTDEEEEIKHILAEGARKCWQTWREGKETFSIGSDIFCHVCSIQEHDVNFQLSGFDGYIQNILMPGTKMTYYDYFTQSLIVGNTIHTPASQFSNILYLNNQTPTAIIFFQIRGFINVNDALDILSPNNQANNVLLGVASLPENRDLSNTVTVNEDGVFARSSFELKLRGGVRFERVYEQIHGDQGVTMIYIGEYNQNTLSNLGCTLPTKSWT
jgi:hypothetical protein